MAVAIATAVLLSMQAPDGFVGHAAGCKYRSRDDGDYIVSVSGSSTPFVTIPDFGLSEGKTGTTLDLDQRAWWISTRDNDFKW